MPTKDAAPARAGRRAGAEHKYLVEVPLTSQEGRQRAMNIIQRLTDVPLMTDGALRALVNETTMTIERVTGNYRFDRGEQEDVPAPVQAAIEDQDYDIAWG